MQQADIAIAGAGLIGASLALELAGRGLRVALISEALPLAHASSSAAGMLAVDDPENPPALHALSAFSRALYPEFLDRLSKTAGTVDARTRFQTHETLQAIAPNPARSLPEIRRADLPSLVAGLRSGDHTFTLLQEASLDPRELALAVRLALARSSRIELHTHTRVLSVTEDAASAMLATSSAPISAANFVDCTGAWSIPSPAHPGIPVVPVIPVVPRKGQMLRVALPADVPLTRVVRTAAVYIVPRLHGAHAGQAVIGATVEDRGFDTSVDPGAIAALRASAAALFPALAEAHLVEAWAGLRPATPDGLPVIGRTGERTFIAKGHFRNGILLAPATAQVVADLITGREPAVALDPFSPGRTLIVSGLESASHQTAARSPRDPHRV